MKSVIFLAAVTSVVAQKGPTPSGFPDLSNLAESLLKMNCTKEPSPTNLDPMLQFTPKGVNWPCDFGKPVPYGKVPAGCAKFEVIVARGTSEPGQFGTVVGDPLVARVLKAMPGQSVRGYPVQYPAEANLSPNKGEDAAAFAARRETGPKDIINRITSQSKECPDEKFVLVGYSQGGGVVATVAPRLTAEQKAKVVAVVTYGAGVSLPKDLESKWLNNCAPGDACGGNPGTEGHLSYNNQGTIWHDRSAKYIADAFNGKSQGKIFAKTSKD